jgi:hypothetical protein
MISDWYSIVSEVGTVFSQTFTDKYCVDGRL